MHVEYVQRFVESPGVKQWRNRGGGGRVPPETSDREISADLPGKNRQGKKEKGWKKGKLQKGRWKIENGRVERWKSCKMRRGPFFFFFFFFFACHFSKPLRFVLGLPKWKFYTGKKHFTSGKKSGQITLLPHKNFPVTPLMWSKQNGFQILWTKGKMRTIFTDLWQLIHKLARWWRHFTPARANWFKTNPRKHESNDRAGNTVPLCVLPMRKIWPKSGKFG